MVLFIEESGRQVNMMAKVKNNCKNIFLILCSYDGIIYKGEWKNDKHDGVGEKRLYGFM